MALPRYVNVMACSIYSGFAGRLRDEARRSVGSLSDNG
jgi:hypothetical protein